MRTRTVILCVVILLLAATAASAVVLVSVHAVDQVAPRFDAGAAVRCHSRVLTSLEFVHILGFRGPPDNLLLT